MIKEIPKRIFSYEKGEVKFSLQFDVDEKYMRNLEDMLVILQEAIIEIQDEQLVVRR